MLTGRKAAYIESFYVNKTYLELDIVIMTFGIFDLSPKLGLLNRFCACRNPLQHHNIIIKVTILQAYESISTAGRVLPSGTRLLMALLTVFGVLGMSGENNVALVGKAPVALMPKTATRTPV